MVKKNYSKAQRRSYVEGKIVGYKLAKKKCAAKKYNAATTKKPSKRR